MDIFFDWLRENTELYHDFLFKNDFTSGFPLKFLVFLLRVGVQLGIA